MAVDVVPPEDGVVEVVVVEDGVVEVVVAGADGAWVVPAGLAEEPPPPPPQPAIKRPNGRMKAENLLFHMLFT